MNPFIQAVINANEEIYHLISSGINNALAVETTIGAGGDISTLLDIKAEDIFVKHLSSFGKIESEESGIIGDGTSHIIIDPIDGSFNFINGIPFFAFCFGVFKNGEPYYGLTYEFLTKRFYEAHKGKGAYLNKKRIRVKEFNQKNIIISYYPNKNMDLEKLRNKVKKVRIFGAFGLEMCYVAKGTLDAVFDVRPKVRPVDISSSYIICKEAGAVITDENGDELKFDLNATDRVNVIVANSKEMLDIILDLI